MTKIETPDEILAKAQKANYDMLAYARGARQSVAAVRSERYEWNRSKSTVDGRLVHYFRQRGESVIGILGPAESESWKGVTYKLITDSGEIIRIPGNRQLARLIKRTKCTYQRVRIEYLGKRYLTSRHYEKCYAIHPAPLKDLPIFNTKAARETMAKLKQISDVANERATGKSDERTAEEKKEARRRFVMHMTAAGHKFKRETLKEFKGEAWADKALGGMGE